MYGVSFISKLNRDTSFTSRQPLHYQLQCEKTSDPGFEGVSAAENRNTKLFVKVLGGEAFYQPYSHINHLYTARVEFSALMDEVRFRIEIRTLPVERDSETRTALVNVIKHADRRYKLYFVVLSRLAVAVKRSDVAGILCLYIIQRIVEDI